jgi:tetratricopeptide (TPR) repeat protein
VSEADPVREWLGRPAGESIAAVWPAQTLSESFREFYAAVMRHARASPPDALEAIRRVGPGDRRRLTRVERVRLVRLRAHAFLGSGDARSAARDYRRAWDSFRKLRAAAELGPTGIGWVAALVQVSEYRRATRLAARVRRILPRGDSLALARLDSNLGILFLQSGRYSAAARRFRGARRRFRGAGFENDAAFTTYNLGLSLLPLGRVPEAERCFGEAESRFREKGLAHLALHCRARLSFIDLLRGRVAEALASLDGITRELEAAEDWRVLALVKRQQAEFLAAAGALERAEQLAASSLERYTALGLQTDAAHTAFLHARILSALGRQLDARVRLEQARATWEQTGETTFHRRTTVELAAVFLAKGDDRRAVELLRTVSRSLLRRDRWGASVRCRLLEAQARMNLGFPKRALRLARAAYRDARRLPTRLERPRIALTIAGILARLGRTEQSVRWTRRAVAGFESISLSLGSLSLRGQVSAYQESVHAEIVATVLQTGRPHAPLTALDLLTRARSPQLAEDLLAPGSPRRTALRTSIARLRDEVLSESPPDAGADGSAHQALAELESALDVVSGAPDGVVRSALARRRFASWFPLLEGRTLVHFEERGGEWGAFVVEGRRRVRHVRLPGARRALNEAWIDLRLLFEQAAHLPRDRRREFLETTTNEAQDSMAELRRAVWDPLRIEDGARPVLIPVGALQGVPLESFVTSYDHEPAPVSRWPHPAVIRRWGGLARRSALMLHDGTRARRREARAAAALLRKAEFRVTVSARRTALASSAGLGVLHFAAHGRFHRPRWMLNGIRLGDGWMGFEELRGQSVRSSLIFFGSCESGLATDLPGSEMDGWLSAALGAGASEVVLTLWKIDDETASAFSRAFYSHRARGVGAAAAAARARREVRAAHPHPYAWAPFAVAG